MRAIHYVLLVAFISLVMFLLLNWYVLDGPHVPTYSYRFSHNDTIYPGESMDNLFWFVQVSDLHISKFGYQSRANDFREFCSKIIPNIDPSLVIVTGDLTEARRSRYETNQYTEEWQTYHGIIKETGVANKRPWLDLPGNHDSFNVLEHLTNFRNYSHSWHHYGVDSYCYKHHTSFGDYSFIGVDAHPMPGPRLPYNFFGMLDEADLLDVQQLSQKCGRANHTVWFSHYPSSCITTNHRHFLEILSSSIVYLCGHLHNIFGYFNNLYTVHQDGRLELELADWKHMRRYRVLAIDHDLLSFQDIYLNDLPIVVITNPKHHQFLSHSHEPVNRIAHSTHIRSLVFSPDPIISVTVLLDDKDVGVMHHVNGPLYVAKWQPSDYSNGIHTITVVAKDKGGHITTVTQPFSLDTEPTSIGIFQAFVLQANLPTTLKLLFMFLWLLLVGRLLHARWQGRGLSSEYAVLARINAIYYPLLFCLLNFGIGIWFVGELLSGIYGFVSAHGLFVANTFIPGSITYLHGSFMLVLFHYPMISLLVTLASTKNHSTGKWHGCYTVFCLLLQFTVAITSVYLCINMLTRAYGWTAFVLSPGITWNAIVYLVIIVYILRCNFSNTTL